mgnify:CR=1 FL=1|jgi:AcrR family transcriptional regulator
MALPTISKRPQPTQARSQIRVQKILDTAKALLVEEGYEEMNIQKLSRKANITAPSVYRYFPNKRSIIATFADVFLEAQTQAIHFCLEKSLRGMDWKDVIHTFMIMLCQGMRQEEWIYPAQLAIRSDRFLKEVHEELLDTIADRFTLLFRSFGIKLSDDDIFRVSRIVILLLDAYMLALGRLEPENQTATINEFKIVVLAYIAPHVPPKK